MEQFQMIEYNVCLTTKNLESEVWYGILEQDQKGWILLTIFLLTPVCQFNLTVPQYWYWYQCD